MNALVTFFKRLFNRPEYGVMAYDEQGFYRLVCAAKSRPIRLCESLYQIRKEQRLSIKHREADGFENQPGRYGHKRVLVD